jgi:molybdopterin converting factor small subunit
MMIKIKYFGILAKIAGKREEELEGQSDLRSLENNILSLYPRMADYKYSKAVNQCFVENNPRLKNGDEVFFVPPFPGG